MMAVHRLCLHLLAAMGEAIQEATQAADGSGAHEMVDVPVENVDDDVLLMQMPGQWQVLLQAILKDLESKDKGTASKVSQWLLEWLQHRCTDEARGYYLGHMGEPAASLVSILVTFAGSQSDQDWGITSDEEASSGKLQPYLPCHKGSRQARGLPPAKQPIMIFSRPIPENFDSDVEAQDTSQHSWTSSWTKKKVYRTRAPRSRNRAFESVKMRKTTWRDSSDWRKHRVRRRLSSRECSWLRLPHGALKCRGAPSGSR